MLFEINGTFYIFIASFLIFMVLLNEVMLKPIGRVIAQRAALVDGSLSAGKESHTEAEKLLARYEDDLKKIRHEAQAVIAKSTEEATRNRHEELSRVAETGRNKLQFAKESIETERTSLIDALVAEEKELVETITRKVLGDETVQINIDENQLRRTLEEAH